MDPYTNIVKEQLRGGRQDTKEGRKTELCPCLNYTKVTCMNWLKGILILFLLIYLCLAVLGLCCCAQPFSSCGKWEPLSSWGVQASHGSGFSCWGAQALEQQTSADSIEYRLSSCFTAVGSSRTKD